MLMKRAVWLVVRLFDQWSVGAKHALSDKLFGVLEISLLFLKPSLNLIKVQNWCNFETDMESKTETLRKR